MFRTIILVVVVIAAIVMTVMTFYRSRPIVREKGAMPPQVQREVRDKLDAPALREKLKVPPASERYDKGPDLVIPGSVAFKPGKDHVTVDITYSGDADNDAVVQVRWRRGHEFIMQTANTVEYNREQKTIRAVIEKLESGIMVIVQVQFADPILFDRYFDGQVLMPGKIKPKEPVE